MTGACRICPAEEPSPGGSPLRGVDGAPENQARGSEGLCLVLGAVLIGLGIYFLLQPGVGDSGVINLQRLTWGEAFTISGSIFLAAGLRPR